MTIKVSDERLAMWIAQAPRDSNCELAHEVAMMAVELQEKRALVRECEAAINGLIGLIRGAQDQMSLYIQPDGDADTTLDNLLGLLDGPKQREVESKATALLARVRGGV